MQRGSIEEALLTFYRATSTGSEEAGTRTNIFIERSPSPSIRGGQRKSKEVQNFNVTDFIQQLNRNNIFEEQCLSPPMRGGQDGAH